MRLVFLMIALAAPAETPTGVRVDFKDLGATLFVPAGYRPGAGHVVDVLLHLHGSSSVVQPALAESGFNAVLIEFNRKGLSKVYAEPFSDPALFARLLDAAINALKTEKIVAEPKLGKVVVSSFSAGFGGVRALLRVPESFDRIDGLVMLDSIYCGYAGDPAKHDVDPALMEGFRRFAVEAVAGRKTFLLTHSAQVPEGYASTTETADFLIKKLGKGTTFPDREEAPGLTPTRTYIQGRFVVLGFAGKEANDHMVHLRRISTFWKRYRAIADPASP